VEVSQPLFAFKWEDPDTGTKGQLAWARLQQGFKNSPTIFGEALARDLVDCQLKDCTIPRYVDDILLAAPTLEACRNETENYSNSYRKQDTKSHKRKHRSV
jgi:hypothetical protein